MNLIDFLKSRIILFIGLLVLSGCPAPGPECIYAGDLGDIIRTTVTVDAKKEFTETGIRASSGEPIFIDVDGHVDLCVSGHNIGSSKISPMISDWQDSGYKVKEGDPFSVFVEGSYKDSTGNDFVDGRGLYMLILPEDETPNNGIFWYGTNSSYNLGANATVDYYPNFIHMCNNGSIGDASAGGSGCTNGFSGLVPDINGDNDIYDKPVRGKVWFRYARRASVVGTSNSGNDDERYSPWRGEYKWHSVQCPACIATLAVPCFDLVTCGAKGIAIGVSCGKHNRWPDAENCREVTAGDGSGDTDHWVCDAYDNNGNGISEDYTDASGISKGQKCKDNSVEGYDIIIGTGCPGVNGRYLETYFVSNDTQLQYGNPQVAYKEDGKTPITDFDGNVLKTRNIIGISGAVSINMDPSINPHVTKTGKYSNCDQESEDASSMSSSSCRVPANGTIWLRLVDKEPMPPGEGPTYEDNVGNYKVKIETVKVGSAFSNFTKKLIDPVLQIFYGKCEAEGYEDSTNEQQCPHGLWTAGIVKRMYNGALRDSAGNPTQLVIVLRASMVLYVIVLAFLFMIGASSIDQKTFVISAIKIAIVQQLISPNSWDFFSTYLFPLFTDGINEFISVMTGDLTGLVSSQMVDPTTGNSILDANGNPIFLTPRNPLAFTDKLMSIFFSMNTMFKLSGLIFLAFPIGLFYFIAIIVAIMIYIQALIKALVLYIMAYIALALMISLAPVFIGFLLFKRTRSIFDEWMKLLIGFTLQPILVFTALGIFTIFVYSILYKVLNFDVCWDWVQWAKITGPGGHEFKIFKYYMPASGHKSLGDLPVAFFLLIILLIMIEIFFKMVDWMADMGATIATAAQSTSLNAIAKEAMEKAKFLVSGGASAVKDLAKKAAMKAASSASGKKKKDGGGGGAKRSGGADTAVGSQGGDSPKTSVGIKKE